MPLNALPMCQVLGRPGTPRGIGKPLAVPRFVATRMLDVTHDELRLGHPVRVSRAVLEREGPLQCPACAIEFPLHVPQ
jgi:hypothetical protein